MSQYSFFEDDYPSVEPSPSATRQTTAHSVTPASTLPDYVSYEDFMDETHVSYPTGTGQNNQSYLNSSSKHNDFAPAPSSKYSYRHQDFNEDQFDYDAKRRVEELQEKQRLIQKQLNNHTYSEALSNRSSDGFISSAKVGANISTRNVQGENFSGYSNFVDDAIPYSEYVHNTSESPMYSAVNYSNPSKKLQSNARNPNEPQSIKNHSNDQYYNASWSKQASDSDYHRMHDGYQQGFDDNYNNYSNESHFNQRGSHMAQNGYAGESNGDFHEIGSSQIHGMTQNDICYQSQQTYPDQQEYSHQNQQQEVANSDTHFHEKERFQAEYSNLTSQYELEPLNFTYVHDGTWKDAFFEFYLSEREHVQLLEVLQNIYVKEIKNCFPFETTSYEMKLIISQLNLVEALLKMHVTDFGHIYKKPFKRLTLEDAMDAFLYFPSAIGTYNSYCGNDDETQANIAQQRKVSSKFNSILQECEKKCGISLEQFLSLPFNRLLKYPDYLNKIGFCFPTETEEFKYLADVFSQLSARVNAVKDAKWAAESTAKIIKMNSVIDGISQITLNIPTRRFVLEGDIIKINHGRAQKRKFFVFNDLIVYCKEGFHGKITFCGSVEMENFTVEDEPASKNYPTKFALRITRFNVLTKSKKRKDQVVWILCFESAEEKSLWSKTLTLAVERHTTQKNYDEASALLTALLDQNTLSYSEPPVGEGATGIVYKGLYRGEKQVAIKKIKNVNILTKAEKDAFISEVQILKTFQCPQIVEFVGCVVTPNDLWTVSEFVFMGTLKSFIKNMSSIPLRFKVLFILDIARGLEYLHKHSIMHRDIKSDNVLVATVSVSAVSRVKLTDFGASRIVKDKTERNYTRIGTPIYVSPEVLRGDSYSFSTDVYSFAILMWEIMNQTEPYQNLPDSHSISRFVLSGKRLPIPDQTPKDLGLLIKKCWDGSPKNRPDFSKIVAVVYQVSLDKEVIATQPV